LQSKVEEALDPVPRVEAPGGLFLAVQGRGSLRSRKELRSWSGAELDKRPAWAHVELTKLVNKLAPS